MQWPESNVNGYRFYVFEFDNRLIEFGVEMSVIHIYPFSEKKTLSRQASSRPKAYDLDAGRIITINISIIIICRQ